MAFLFFFFIMICLQTCNFEIWGYTNWFILTIFNFMATPICCAWYDSTIVPPSLHLFLYLNRYLRNFPHFRLNKPTCLIYPGNDYYFHVEVHKKVFRMTKFHDSKSLYHAKTNAADGCKIRFVEVGPKHRDFSWF